jgi:membrane fusion protein (multidrug efflux system)
MSRHGWIAPTLLLLVVICTGVGLGVWKYLSIVQAMAASANPPEPVETIETAVAKPREYRRSTTAIGTVMALRSITLRNEIAGTVRQVALTPGQVVESGALLVALDTSVEEAELKAQEAQAALAETVLARTRKAGRALSEENLDHTVADRDIAVAQVARTKAIIARKTIRAPFRARVGIADVHPGQYLNEGTQITTLQGVEPAVNIDFTVAQRVAAGLRDGEAIEILSISDDSPSVARIMAVDARVDPATRNAMVRARMESAENGPRPGASVRVRVPVGPPLTVVAVPVSALRKGPAGDQVFVIVPDKEGMLRAHARQVDSGAVLGDEVLIYTGLAAGEQVAACGSFKLREGVAVAVP